MKESKIKITGDKILDDLPSGNTLDVATVSALAAVVERHGLSELKLSLAGGTLVIRRGPPPPPAQVVHAAPPAPPTAVLTVAQPTPVAAALGASTPPAAASAAPAVAHEANGQYVYVSSPFVGTYYSSPSPGSPPFVEIGQSGRHRSAPPASPGRAYGRIH